MKIVALFPGVADGPVGGYKVLLEYLSQLADEGHDVTACYAGSIYFARKTPKYKVTGILRMAQRLIQGYSCRRWLPTLSRKLKERHTLSLNYRHVPKGADRYIATSPYTADYLEKYPLEPALKYYFIQDREDWGTGLREIVDDTYHMCLNKVTVSHWLQDMLRFQYGEMSELVPNSFDFANLQLVNPPAARSVPVVAMLWHQMPRKDCSTGMEALRLVAQQVPNLQIELFGAPSRPDDIIASLGSDLATRVNYTRNATRAQVCDILNRATVFIGTSRTEGWGLTVGEAMICGAAVACTDCKGYLEMARPGINALVSPVGDSKALATNIVRLLTDSELRITLAKRASDDIRRFSPDRSYQLFKEALGIN
ncbi:MAG: glycosyltransferase family 4 protein [Candidatus Amulumruptor caecigallinarius]|nr:glycosyltransferase family 4 protein [Candidatus Amulumruptor caecigallinarius]MCM1396289.1 glycosyltransferase family 4 protein [Candidatus Amulumruptor caecigallinarius]MCM1454283.1 glycosyltransferase family 4 protein [bacterium]